VASLTANLANDCVPVLHRRVHLTKHLLGVQMFLMYRQIICFQ